MLNVLILKRIRANFKKSKAKQLFLNIKTLQLMNNFLKFTIFGFSISLLTLFKTIIIVLVILSIYLLNINYKYIKGSFFFLFKC